MNNKVEKIISAYRKMSLREIIEIRLYGNCVQSLAEKVIFEKVDRANISIKSAEDWETLGNKEV